jgi:hypothetical protein
MLLPERESVGARRLAGTQAEPEARRQSREAAQHTRPLTCSLRSAGIITVYIGIRGKKLYLDDFHS